MKNVAVAMFFNYFISEELRYKVSILDTKLVYLNV